MHHAVIGVVRHRPALGAHARGKGDAIIHQRIALCGHQRHRRQAGERLRAHRRRTPVFRLVPRQIALEEPHQRFPIEEKPVGVGLATGPVAVDFGAWINHRQMAQRRRLAPLAPRQRDGQGQVAAGAVATHRHRVGVDLQQIGMLDRPVHRQLRIQKRRGKRVLRCEAVLHRQHRRTGTVGQLAAQHVVGRHIADAPAAAVAIHQQRQHRAGAGLQRAVEARHQRAAIVARNRHIGD